MQYGIRQLIYSRQNCLARQITTDMHKRCMWNFWVLLKMFFVTCKSLTACSCSHYGFHLIVVSYIIALCVVADSNSCSKDLQPPSLGSLREEEVLVEQGHPLNIVCSLKDENVNDTSSVVFYRNSDRLNPSLVTINSTGHAVINVSTSTVGIFLYYYKLIGPDGCFTTDKNFCGHRIRIGTKPKMPRTFQCFSDNLENVTCTWHVISNGIPTYYFLTIDEPAVPKYETDYTCPDGRNARRFDAQYVCKWSESVVPTFTRNSTVSFYLNGSNSLGNLTQVYKFLVADARPSPPENLTVSPVTGNTATVTWSNSILKRNFPPGLHHLMEYWIAGKLSAKKTIYILNNTQSYSQSVVITDLNAGNVLYRVSVSSKSANSKLENWSKRANTTFWTPPRLPPNASVDYGSFLEVNSGAARDIYIYWRTVLPEFQNGRHFNHIITHVEENGTAVALRPIEITKLRTRFAKLKIDSNYTFYVNTINEVGLGAVEQRIFIPQRQNRLPRPTSFVRIEIKDNRYQTTLSWMPSHFRALTITNFTIFRCVNEFQHPRTCDGQLDWITVPKEVRELNVSTPDLLKHYEFAISANSEAGSSGMKWTECIVSQKVTGFLTFMWTEVKSSKEIHVTWKFRCSDNFNQMEHIVIELCKVRKEGDLECQKPMIKKVVPAAHDGYMGAMMENLQPHTLYKISLSVESGQGGKWKSNVSYKRTLEDAPSTPPLNIKLINATKSSVALQWDEPQKLNGVLQHYKLYYDNKTIYIDGKKEVVIAGLPRAHAFTVVMEACTVKCSEKSAPLRVETRPGLPGQLKAPTVQFIGSRRVSVSWSPSERSRDTQVTYYEIFSRSTPIFRTTKLRAEIPLPYCDSGTVNYVEHQIHVREVVIEGNNVLQGPFSFPGQASITCEDQTEYVVTWAVRGLVLFTIFLFAVYYGKRLCFHHLFTCDKILISLPHGLKYDSTTDLNQDTDDTNETLDEDRIKDADTTMLTNFVQSRTKERNGYVPHEILSKGIFPPVRSAELNAKAARNTDIVVAAEIHYDDSMSSSDVDNNTNHIPNTSQRAAENAARTPVELWPSNLEIYRIEALKENQVAAGHSPMTNANNYVPHTLHKDICQAVPPINNENPNVINWKEDIEMPVMKKESPYVSIASLAEVSKPVRYKMTPTLFPVTEISVESLIANEVKKKTLLPPTNSDSSNQPFEWDSISEFTDSESVEQKPSDPKLTRIPKIEEHLSPFISTAHPENCYVQVSSLKKVPEKGMERKFRSFRDSIVNHFMVFDEI